MFNGPINLREPLEVYISTWCNYHTGITQIKLSKINVHSTYYLVKVFVFWCVFDWIWLCQVYLTTPHLWVPYKEQLQFRLCSTNEYLLSVFLLFYILHWNACNIGISPSTTLTEIFLVRLAHCSTFRLCECNTALLFFLFSLSMPSPCVILFVMVSVFLTAMCRITNYQVLLMFWLVCLWQICKFIANFGGLIWLSVTNLWILLLKLSTEMLQTTNSLGGYLMFLVLSLILCKWSLPFSCHVLDIRTSAIPLILTFFKWTDIAEIHLIMVLLLLHRHMLHHLLVNHITMAAILLQVLIHRHPLQMMETKTMDWLLGLL